MSQRTIGIAALLAFLCIPCPTLHAAPLATNAAFRIPHLARAVIDADPAGWGDNGFRVDVLPDVHGSLQPAAQFDPRLRLAWNEDGLLLRFDVRDSVLRESATADTLYLGDACEVFLARAPGAPESYQVVIAPGVDPRFAKPRTVFSGRHPPIPLTNLTITVAARKTADGYVTEALLPWRNLGLAGATAGDRVAFQTLVDDAGHGQTFNGTWFPTADTSRNSNSFYTVELADTASAPEGLTAWGDYDGMRLTRFHAVATAAAAGRVFRVDAGGQTLGRAVLSNRNDRAEAEIVLPFPAPGKPWPPLDLRLDDRLLRVVALPNADQLRARAFTAADFTFDAYCFAGPAFPSGNFAQPEFVETLIGPYTLGFRYYDADGRAVNAADRPGRYAAVVEIAHGAGRISRRFFTLYRLPNDYRPPREALRPVPGANSAPQPRTLLPLSANAAAGGRASGSLPPTLGIPPRALAEHRQELDDFCSLRLNTTLLHDPAAAILLAGLRAPDVADTGVAGAMAAGAVNTWAGSIRFAERQWWVTFKRQYYGTAQIFGRPLAAPQPVVAPPAPMLRPGTPAAAGLDPAFSNAFARLCESWAAVSGVGFNVVVARHGMIVADAGFGTWDDEPVTPKTRCQLASTTKFLSACLMLQAVHQGLVRLDDPAERYLPAWRDVPVRRKMTVHELYDQTSGFAEHWSDELNDLEELTADYYPTLDVGVRVTYQGTGHALGNKILEYLTGEPLPAIFRDYLFGPLGCAASESEYSAAGAVSTAGDLAKVGQMMLNGGAYGNWRFCTSNEVRQLQSPPEKQRLGPDPHIRWGMGIKAYDSDGLSGQAYGHPGATGAFLFIDPARDLVVAMARNDEGNDYLEWRHKMFGVILDNLR